MVAYIFTSQIDFVHAFWCRNEQFDAELLTCNVYFRGHLTTFRTKIGNLSHTPFI